MSGARLRRRIVLHLWRGLLFEVNFDEISGMQMHQQTITRENLYISFEGFVEIVRRQILEELRKGLCKLPRNQR